MLRYTSDLRSLAFMFLTTLLLVVLWQFGPELPTLTWVVLYVLQLLMAVVVSVMTHNHQHLPMWTNKLMNRLTDNWLTVFYGFPVFAWIPTHNTNHHVHVNTEPDYTRTYRFSEKNNLITLLTYPSLSASVQQKAVGRFLVNMWGRDKKLFFLYCLQIAVLLAWTIGALVLDWRKGLLYVVIPQQVSLYTVLVFNYLQHIHTDEESKYNNSRNFTGKLLNFILLNNGLHTAHHDNAGIHWSKLPERHRELEPMIDDELNQSNFFGFLFRCYVLGIFIPGFRSKSIRVARIRQNATSTHTQRG